jgi:hypothetical protein
MANPLSHEHEIYEAIKQKRITIDPDLRELINHHIRNDLNAINMFTGEYAFIPVWILKVASGLIWFLFKITRQPGVPPKDIISLYKGVMSRSKAIVAFMNKLGETFDEAKGETDA